MAQKILAGRYEIYEKIGDGGMAVVYKARDKLLSRMVAIKILRPEFVNDTNFVESFRRESRAAASLSHPNIVNIYDVGQEGNVHFIVMELVEGRTLSEVIAVQAPLDYKKAISIAKQIASALSLAHRNNIVHRDVKPHNILITPDGSAKITDFGIARAVTDATIIRDTNTVMGSAHYFSPEQGRGQYVDEKSDIYSLGIVIFEMLTGRVPFDADNPVAIALMHMNDPIIPPSQLVPGIPPGLEQIVLKATEKYQVNRFHSIDEMIVALDNVNFVTGVIEDPIARSYVSRPDQQPDPADGYEGHNSAYDNYDGGDGYDADSEDDDYYDDGYDEDDDDYEDDRYDKRKRSSKKGKNGGKRKGKGGKTKTIAIILAILAALALAFVIYQGYNILTGAGEKKVDVPQLIELPYDEAEAVAVAEGLTIKAISEEYSDTVSEGAITKQNPEFGSKIEEGGLIEVILSRGPQDETGDDEPKDETIEVPNVVGKTAKDAKTLLEEEYNLTVKEVREDNDNEPLNIVFKQDPQEGDKVDPGTEVTITISNGPALKKVAVPDLRGKTRNEARTLLTDKNLQLGTVTEEFSDSVEKGLVISQSPRQNSTVTEKSKVNIVISKGIEEKSGSTVINVNYLDAPTDSFTLSIQLINSQGVGKYIVKNQPKTKDDIGEDIPVSGKGICTVKVYFSSGLYKTYRVDFNQSPPVVEAI